MAEEIRSIDELIKAHDIFYFLYTENVKVITNLDKPEEITLIVRTILETLCWVLKHESGEDFDKRLLGLEADLFSQLGVDFAKRTEHSS